MHNSYFKMIADKGFTAQIRSKRPTFDQQTRYVKPKSKVECPFIIYSASESEDSDNVSCFICKCVLFKMLAHSFYCRVRVYQEKEILK